MMVLICQEIAKMTDRIPKPVFILQNSGPITSVLFSEFKEEILFTSNRNGYLNIYDLNLRRSIFECNPISESILSVAELSENSILTHSRNGTIHKWTQTQTEWISQSKFVLHVFLSGIILNFILLQVFTRRKFIHFVNLHLVKKRVSYIFHQMKRRS
jgi:WD40 repeat protein